MKKLILGAILLIVAIFFIIEPATAGEWVKRWQYVWQQQPDGTFAWMYVWNWVWIP